MCGEPVRPSAKIDGVDDIAEEREESNGDDYARVLPLTYAVFGVLVTIGLLALFRDIVDPIDLG